MSGDILLDIAIGLTGYIGLCMYDYEMGYKAGKASVVVLFICWLAI